MTDRALPVRRGGIIPAETVAEARRLYEAGGLTQVEIARSLGVHRNTIRRLAAQGGWSAPEGGRAALVTRIRARVDAEIVEVERTLGQAGAKGPDASERAARTLASLVRTLRELARFDEDRSRAGGASPDDDQAAGREDDDDAVADLDGLRRALAERLERLRAEREP